MTCNLCRVWTEEVLELRRALKDSKLLITTLQERVRLLEPKDLPPPPPGTSPAYEPFNGIRFPSYDERPAHLRR